MIPHRYEIPFVVAANWDGLRGGTATGAAPARYSRLLTPRYAGTGQMQGVQH